MVKTLQGKDMDQSYQAARLLLEGKAEQDFALAEQLKEARAIRPVVVRGQHDHIHKLFDHLGISYDKVQMRELPSMSLDGRPVFVNCGRFPNTGWRVRKTISKHVEKGGQLVTTDWALDEILNKVFPGFVAWDGKKTGSNESWPIDAAQEVGRAEWFVENCSYPVAVEQEGVVKRILTSKAFAARYKCDPALAVTFRVGKGRVTHYVSHLYSQVVELRTARDKAPSTCYSEAMGVDPAKIGDLGKTTRTGGVKSAYSTYRSVMDSMTEPVSPHSSPFQQTSVGPGDKFSLFASEGYFSGGKNKVNISGLERELVIGRASSCDINVSESAVSRIHAGLVPAGDRIVLLRDLESRNGTYVNGKDVGNGVPLFYGDNIKLGKRAELKVTH